MTPNFGIPIRQLHTFNEQDFRERPATLDDPLMLKARKRGTTLTEPAHEGRVDFWS